MSHFTVLVIGDNWEDQLAPFNEQTEDKRFLKFDDEEEEMRKAYETDGVTRVVMPDGRLLTTWDEEFRKKGTSGIIGSGSSTHEVPVNLEKRIIPFKETYSTFEDFAKDWYGMEPDPETGKYGSWENPNAKWDWYQMGGRWSGMFRKKSNGKIVNREAVRGEKGLMGSCSNEGEEWADQLQKKDIDIEFMRHKSATEAKTRYLSIAKFFEGGIIPKIKTWAECRKETNNDIDKARDIYHAQKGVEIFNAAKGDDIFSSLDEYQMSLDEYVKQAIDSTFVTFAVLKDGKWYENGEMGWWGCVSNEKEKDKWNEEFNKLFDSLPEDTLLTVVDCHI